jgi:hypothetical protein
MHATADGALTSEKPGALWAPRALIPLAWEALAYQKKS